VLEVRDLDGRQVSIAEARRIIAERHAVPEEVRRRRRSTKPRRGKAPQHVLNGRAHHGASRARIEATFPAPILDRAHGKVNPLRATRHRRH
jgi:hypothetical protein